VWEDGVDQVRRELRHAPPATARTKAASLAGERHEALERTAFASHAREAAGEDAARQELSELALDELGQAVCVGAGRDLGAESLEVLADDSMEDRALHGARLVAGGERPPGTLRRIFH